MTIQIGIISIIVLIVRRLCYHTSQSILHGPGRIETTEQAEGDEKTIKMMMMIGTVLCLLWFHEVVVMVMVVMMVMVIIVGMLMEEIEETGFEAFHG